MTSSSSKGCDRGNHEGSNNSPDPSNRPFHHGDRAVRRGCRGRRPCAPRRLRDMSSCHHDERSPLAFRCRKQSDDVFGSQRIARRQPSKADRPSACQQAGTRPVPHSAPRWWRNAVACMLALRCWRYPDPGRDSAAVSPAGVRNRREPGSISRPQGGRRRSSQAPARRRGLVRFLPIRPASPGSPADQSGRGQPMPGVFSYFC